MLSLKVKNATLTDNVPDIVTKLCQDISTFRLYHPVQIHKMAGNRLFMKLKYLDRGISLINLPKIFNDADVRKTIPNYFKITEPPCISYQYTKTIAGKIFNYSEAIEQFDYNAFTTDEYKCDCESSEFLYKPLKHVITGNLDIIPNKQLKILFMKGPKYREQRTINLRADQRIIFDALEQYIIDWSKREKVDPSVLNDWRDLIKSRIKNNIRHIPRSSLCHKKQILQDETVKNVLANLQRKYVIVPADKAPNNIVFVCKYYYFKVLVEELGIAANSGSNSTYKAIDISAENIYSNHKQ